MATLNKKARKAKILNEGLTIPIGKKVAKLGGLNPDKNDKRNGHYNMSIGVRARNLDDKPVISFVLSRWSDGGSVDREYTSIEALMADVHPALQLAEKELSQV